jgi:hypothetical protein
MYPPDHGQRAESESEILAAYGGPPIFDTVLFGGMAVFAFFRMCCYDLDPIVGYRSLAWKCLLVSFLPDVVLAIDHRFGWT